MMDAEAVLARFKLIAGRKEVVVKCEHNDKELKTESGIYLGTPSIIHDRPTCGIIIQKTDAVVEVDLNDKVHFDITKGIDLCHTGEEWYIILKVDDIIGVESAT